MEHNVILEHNILLAINMLCHIGIFISTFYIALQNRIIPNIILTEMWYIGLASIFCSITIILELVFGSEMYLSYSKVGYIGETVLNLAIAITVGTIMFMTIEKDLKQRKRRKRQPLYD